MHRLKGEDVALYRRIESLVTTLNAFVRTLNREDELWWDLTSATTTYEEEFWPPVETRQLLTIYYALLIRALPCPLGRITDDKISWSCVVHPRTFTVKIFPSPDGKVLIPADSERPIFHLFFHTSFRTYATNVCVYNPWQYTDVGVEQRIDCSLLQKLFAARLSLFDARQVMNIVMDSK